MQSKELLKVVKRHGGIAVHYVDNIYNVVLPEVHGEWYVMLVDGSGWRPGVACKIVKPAVQGIAGGTTVAVATAAGLERAIQLIKERGGYHD